MHKIRIEDFNYPLEESKIAKYPLPDRDGSKLLFDNGMLTEEKRFKDLPSLLPKDAVLVFNDTKVFHARLLFRKESGATIELFCLEPQGLDFQQAFATRSEVVWHCLIGNAKRWKTGPLIFTMRVGGLEVILKAEKLSFNQGLGLIEFKWDHSTVSFGEIVDVAGAVPIPPYLKRASEESDKSRYQTHYAKVKGSVAAPTAGLHFTEDVFNRLKAQGIDWRFLTLHVGAGTFKPVVSQSIEDHEMHPETFSVDISTLEWLAENLGKRPLIAVGTTTVRTLESLYWMGVDSNHVLCQEVEQWRPYRDNSQLEVSEALSRLIKHLRNRESGELEGVTRLMIRPGYQFRLVQGLVTNFHQPKSTLLLLVAALIGDRWKDAYDFALQHQFRFLSYGDSCFFIPSERFL